MKFSNSPASVCRRARGQCGIGLSILLASGSLPANPPTLEVSRLIDEGALSLALEEIEQAQAKTQPSSIWLALEQQRYLLYRRRGDWQTLLERTGEVTDQVSRQDRWWVDAHRAEALIELDRQSDAIRLIRDLIWLGSAEPPEPELGVLRRSLVQAYLSAGLAEDAYIAMNRVRLDYGEADGEARLLQAKVLLGVGRADDAIRLLRSDASMEASVLRASAQLKADSRHAAGVLAEMRAAIEKEVSPSTRFAALLTAAEAARLLRNWRDSADFMERARLVPGSDLEHGGLTPLQLSGAMLWQAYIQLGESIGNERQLLRGEDQRWYNLGRDLFAADPLAARGIFAFLSREAKSERIRELAEMQFGLTFPDTPEQATLLELLFLDDTFYPSLNGVPETVRHRLAQAAVQRGEIAEASRRLRDLEEPPPGADFWNWHLLRARILIMGGAPEHGAVALKQLLDRVANPEPAQRDRLLQVVFDLQTMGSHRAAVGLLDQVAQREVDPGVRRELLYWSAESAKALDEYASAARYYLASALEIPEKSWDPWAQTARFQAASVLGRAGMVEDARRLFKAVLERTVDSKRKARIQREIDQLYLTRGGSGAE